METVENKYITLAYKLYTIENGEKEFTEEAPAEHPFQFISGLGLTLESFENQVKDLNKGDKFDFTIKAEEAYGEYDEEHVIDLPKKHLRDRRQVRQRTRSRRRRNPLDDLGRPTYQRKRSRSKGRCSSNGHESPPGRLRPELRR